MAKGISVYKKKTIDRYLKIKNHLVVEKKKKENSNNIIVGFAKQYDKDKVTIIQQMQCVYFAVKNYISLNVYPKLCHLVKLRIKVSLLLILLFQSKSWMIQFQPVQIMVHTQIISQEEC